MRGRYNAAISACVKGWLGQSALLLLGRMEQNALEANVISYNAAIWAVAARQNYSRLGKLSWRPT